MVMPFGVKNGPPTFQRVVNRAFREYLDKFMNNVWMISQFIVIGRIIWWSLDFVLKNVKNIDSILTHKNVPLWCFQD